MIFHLLPLLIFLMDPIPIFDFHPDADLNNWTVVNDGVMGGRSRSTLSLDQAGHGVFSGRVSLENNGGFASIRLQCGRIDLNSKAMVLRVKGDGKRYQFRIRARKNDYYSYIHYFETSGDWEDISLPLADFYPTFRGRKLDLPNFSGNVLEEIGILIGNKRPENFQLLIDSIGLKAN
jgi:NADH dehydrogenase [ubiquinone] 1 alpha subcomplex assembly factor 1